MIASLWGPLVGPHQNGAGGLNDLAGALLCIKNQAHLIILTLLSTAHKITQSKMGAQSIQQSTLLDGCKPRG